MNFISPTAFWFAATIPVVILFYLLKRKRLVKLISSTLLWQKFLAETQASAPFQKLRHNWLLLLQLLLLILAIFALSRPYFSGNTKTSALRVVILDASASMQSADETPSRFEKARHEALKWVDSLRDQDQMLVLHVAAHTEVKQSATSNKSALRRALQNCDVTDSPTRLSEALKIAETLTRDRPDAEIHLFSDGAASDYSALENKSLRLVYHQIGNRAHNLGIITLDLRANPEDKSQRAIYTSVQNFSAAAQSAQLELRFENQMIETRSLTIQPNEISPQIFLAPQITNGIFTVRLDVKDDLAADNQASIASILPQPVKVLLVTRGNRFLEKALRAAENVTLNVATDLNDSAVNFDVVALDDVLPTTWPRGNILAIHIANTNWFDGTSKIENPTIVDWKNTHPLLRYVSFDNVQISETLRVKTPTWAISLVDAPQTPLLLTGELARQKIVWLGFDTLQSTWPLRISFPIFVANAVEFLNPASSKNNQLMIRSGDPFRLSLVQSEKNAAITFPDGTQKQISLAANSREIVFGDTTKQGIYKLRIGTNETVFCVNLLDAAESNTKPKAELQFGKYGKVEASSIQRANLELWRWIAAAALAILMFEWWFYHRRTA